MRRTLSGETVWARTHRVGGRMVLLMGLLLIAAGIPRDGTLAHRGTRGIGSVALALALLIYSYVIWRAEQHGS